MTDKDLDDHLESCNRTLLSKFTPTMKGLLKVSLIRQALEDAYAKIDRKQAPLRGQLNMCSSQEKALRKKEIAALEQSLANAQEELRAIPII